MDNGNIKKNFKNMNPEELKNRLNGEQQALLSRLLADKDAREKFLSSPEAQNLLRMLSKM